MLTEMFFLPLVLVGVRALVWVNGVVCRKDVPRVPQLPQYATKCLLVVLCGVVVCEVWVTTDNEK